MIGAIPAWLSLFARKRKVQYDNIKQTNFSGLVEQLLQDADVTVKQDRVALDVSHGTWNAVDCAGRCGTTSSSAPLSPWYGRDIAGLSALHEAAVQ